MFIEIQKLLSTLSKQPADYSLNEADWINVIALYVQTDETNQNYLVQGLAQHTRVEPAKIHAFLCEPTAIESFSKMQLDAQKQARENFSLRVKKCIPQIDKLALTDTQWLELLRRFTRQNARQVTSAFLFHHLQQITQLSYDNLIKQLNDERPTRTVKHTKPDIKQRAAKRQKYRDTDDGSPNFLILPEESENKFLHSPLSKQGVRITPLTPVTPEKEGSTRKIYRTPGKTKVRKLWSHERINESEDDTLSLSFFKQSTPSPKKVHLTHTREHVGKKLTKLRLFQHEQAIHFQATLEQLEQRQNCRRQIGQNQLTGASCQAVFAAYDHTIIIENRSKYHWSHLIAHFLGGEQSIENLIPATAASNYNVLEIVEQFIAKKLVHDKVDMINICVEPVYSDDTDIPSELTFTLTWAELGHNHSEIIHINPRSHERLTYSMLKSVNFVRDAFQAKAEKEEETAGTLNFNSGF